MAPEEMKDSRVYVDFLKTDDLRRVLLTTQGTLKDLAQSGIQLHEGLVLSVYSDDADSQGNRDNLLAVGVVRFDEGMKVWVLEIDWTSITHESDDKTAMR